MSLVLHTRVSQRRRSGRSTIFRTDASRRESPVRPLRCRLLRRPACELKISFVTSRTSCGQKTFRAARIWRRRKCTKPHVEVGLEESVNRRSSVGESLTCRRYPQAFSSLSRPIRFQRRGIVATAIERRKSRRDIGFRSSTSGVTQVIVSHLGERIDETRTCIDTRACNRHGRLRMAQNTSTCFFGNRIYGTPCW